MPDPRPPDATLGPRRRPPPAARTRVGTPRPAAALGVALAFGVSLALFSPATTRATTDDVDLVSRAAGRDGVKANGPQGESNRPAISADGRFVAFASYASNLHPDDTAMNVDVFRRDMKTHAMALISRGGSEHGVDPTISADGRYVAFRSYSTLGSEQSSQVYVRDIEAGTTVLASRASGAGAAGNGISYSPAISADGRYVTFVSYATNLHPDARGVHLFARDLRAGTTTLVSRATGVAGAPGNRSPGRPAISADGRFVVFGSRARNLHPDAPLGGEQVFVRDLRANTTTLVSRAAGAAGAAGNRDSQFPSVSGNGRFVAFGSSASNLHPDDGDAARDVFVRDRQTNATTLVSRASGAAGAASNHISDAVGISSDGRSVLFGSSASNLHPADPNHRSDLFVRDLRTHGTSLVSREPGASGAVGNHQSWEGAISADGSFVAFFSLASNLHLADRDMLSDVFRRQMRRAGTPRPEVRIKAVRFDAHQVVRDRASNLAEHIDEFHAACPVPHDAVEWKDCDPAFPDGRTEKNWPLVAVRGTKLRLARVLLAVGDTGAALNNATVTGTARLGGRTMRWKTTAPVDEKDGVLDAGAMVSDHALPGAVARYDDMTIAWKVRAGGKTLDAGSSSHPLYVVYDRPIDRASLYLSLVDLTTRAAAGRDGAPAVAAGIWRRFRRRALHPRSLNPVTGAVTVSADVLRYWQPWTLLGDDFFVRPPPQPCRRNAGTLEILTTMIGRCGSWAELFEDTLGAQGLRAKIRAVGDAPGFPKGPPGATAMLINDWTFAGPPRPGAFPYQTDIDLPAFGRPAFGAVKQVADVPGVAGQGKAVVPNPPGWLKLGDLDVVRYDGRIYDPSYGSGPFQNVRAWARASLAGFARLTRASVDPEGPGGARETVTIHAVPARPGERYVALGDSYSSGTGTGAYFHAECRRSLHAFPWLVDAVRPNTDVVQGACHGATTDDVRRNQLGHLTRNTRWVTITVGGNDAGFRGVLTECAKVDEDGDGDGDCARVVETARRIIRNRLPARLDRLYRAIRSRSPSATVMVLPYPRLFSDAICLAFVTEITLKEKHLLNATTLIMRDKIQEAAERAGPGFRVLDAGKPFHTHALCTDAPWLNHLTLPIADSFHPNRAGHSEGLSPLVRDVMGSNLTDG